MTFLSVFMTMEKVFVNAAGIANGRGTADHRLLKQCNNGDGYGRWCHNKCHLQNGKKVQFIK